MAVRIGVDVGGTFTKAVACEATSGEIVARCVVPTTHAAPGGVAEGVSQAVEGVVSEVDRSGFGPVVLVGHSTTQAVNALLEGDTALVGVLGIGRRPDLARTRDRTRVQDVKVAPGRSLRTVSEIVDATDGLTRDQALGALQRLRDRGAEAVVISEAFGVEDPATERLCLALAADLGLPACAGHELSGLYGLEMRTVTAALNASILPDSLRATQFVAAAVERVAPGAALLVMRGDGGAADARSVGRQPLLTAFSGPAASVAGALRHLSVQDAAIVEVGGTSTNVSAIRGGRPVLAQVRIMDHVTHVRSLDVRVTGVAGGSLIRLARGRLGAWRVAGVGPRSAHIGGLPYASFLAPEELTGARAVLDAPRPADTPDHLIILTADGRRVGLTLTCAANALGVAAPGSYAVGQPESARLGFAAAARLIGQPWERLAHGVLERGAQMVGVVIGDLIREYRMDRPMIVGLGGGAGALIPTVAQGLGCAWQLPANAEVISSIGDALSSIRVEVEHTVARGDGRAIAAAHRAAEERALQAGADPDGLVVEGEAIPERSSVRVVAIGSVALNGQSGPNATHAESTELRRIGTSLIGGDPEITARTEAHAVFARGIGHRAQFAILDLRGSAVASGRGEVLTGAGLEVAQRLLERVPQLVRGFGPLRVAPSVRVCRGARLIDLSLTTSVEDVLKAAVAECEIGSDQTVVAILSRP